MRAPFHLALPVLDLESSRTFYVDVVQAVVGREAERWIDLDFWGHQVSLHLVESISPEATNPVDGEQVPARHFGVVLPWEEWHAMVQRLDERGTPWLIAPCTRFAGEVGEQATAFLRDPSGNALEFKAFRDPAQLFAR